jgi:hypothetical protein
MATKLKLMGVDVASFGDVFATTPGSLELVFADAVAGVYKKLVVSSDATRLWAASSWATPRHTASCVPWSPVASRFRRTRRSSSCRPHARPPR